MTTYKIHNWEDRKSQLRRGRKTIRKYRSLDLTSSSEVEDRILYMEITHYLELGLIQIRVHKQYN